jgi:LL-H family phage holin
LQIKNKLNTENSSSSNIREGTNIKKWYRLNTKIKDGINFINTKIGIENTKKYYNIAQNVVMAVEQQIGNGKGPDKKAEAIAYIKRLLGNTLSDNEINILIEAAVKEMDIVLKQQKFEQ